MESSSFARASAGRIPCTGLPFVPFTIIPSPGFLQFLSTSVISSNQINALLNYCMSANAIPIHFSKSPLFSFEFNHLNHLFPPWPTVFNPRTWNAHGAGAGPGGGWQTLAQVLRQGKVYKYIYIYIYTVNPLDISQETSLTYQNWLRTHKLFLMHGSMDPFEESQVTKHL